MSMLLLKKNNSSGKKNLSERFEQIKEDHPNAQVQIWAMDEHRVGLQPTTQRTWSKVGKRTTQAVQPGYKWRYVWAWVHPSSGQLEVWLSENVNTKLHSKMLKEVAKSIGVSKDNRVIVVLDGASWHTSKKLEIPEGLELFFLPPSTPELQPAERLWPLFDEGLIGLAASKIEEVEEKLEQRSLYLFKHPNIVRGRAFFKWWPDQSY